MAKKQYLLTGTFLFMLVFMLSPFAYGQMKAVKGKVTDASSGLPVAKASIKIKSKQQGTLSDQAGLYELKVAQGEVLVFSSIGFSSKEVVVGEASVIDVQLSPSFEEVGEEIVVVGYTKQSTKTLASSIGVVSNRTLESAPRANVATALQGSVAGLRVQQNTGQPGTTPSIQLRGGTDWGGEGSPLILVDGVQSSFFALNSEDIESISVMKDAASAAIYGARGANGVILVTTKRGKKGFSNINLTTKNTVNRKRVDRTKYLGAADYVKFNRLAVKLFQNQINPSSFEAYLTDIYPAATGNNTTNSVYTTMVLTDDNKYLLNQPGWMTIDDPITPGQKLIFMDNKYDELYYQPSYTQDYTVSFDGGNDRGTFYTSLGYMDDKGIVFGSGFKRFSASLNGSYKVRENFKVSSNIILSRSNQTPSFLDNDYNIFQRSAGMAPTSRIYMNKPDGTLDYDNPHPGVDVNFGNPLYYNDKFVRNNLEERMNASVQFDWAFLPKFNFMLRASHLGINNFKEYFAKAYYSGSNYIASRHSNYNTSRFTNNQLTSTLNYKNSFGKHSIDMVVGSEFFLSNFFQSEASTKNSPTDMIYTQNAGSESNGVPSTEKTAYAIASLFTQAYYSYDNRYLLGVVFRTDGSSKLAEQNRFDYFPGISLGWNMHRENFFQNWQLDKYIDVLKPRVSYGVNGNIETISNFGVYGNYGDAGIYNSSTGYVNTVLPNFALRWERSTTYNFGLDMALFNNKVSIAADYFIKDVYNKLSDLTLPLWTGFSSIKRNIGTMQNRGFELDIKVKAVETKNLSWNIGANLFSVQSYDKKLTPSSLPNNRLGGTRIWDPNTNKVIYVGGLEEGQRVGHDVITAYVFDGVYKTQDEIDADAKRIVTFARKKNQRFLGDAKWRDINGDDTIDYRDRIVLGRTTPTISGGFNTDFSYKNFSLFIRTDFAVGHLAINGRKVKGIAQTQGAQNGPSEILDSWSPSNTNSSIPQFVFTDPQKNHMAGGHDQGDMLNSSSLYWEKADYLALREVTLSYLLSGRHVKNIFKQIKVFATGANLIYFTKFSGSSPEQGGVDSGRFPVPVTFTIGFNATF